MKQENGNRTRRLQLTIESQLDNVPLVGLAVNRICSSVRLSEVGAYQMELSVVEAVTNAILHAYEGKNDREVGVTVEFNDQWLRFEIRDDGNVMPGGDEFNRRRPDYDPLDRQSLPESGWGLFLMDAVMDRMEYKSHEGKNVLTLVKNLKQVGVKN